MSFHEINKTGQAYRVLVDQDDLTGINTYHRLSFWTDASDVDLGNDTTLADVAGDFCYMQGTLLTGQTTVEISGSKIVDGGLIDYYVPIDSEHPDDCRLTAESITLQNNTVTLTFPVQDHDVVVRVVCHNYKNANSMNGG